MTAADTGQGPPAMSDAGPIEDLPELPPEAFLKADATADPLFYANPRFVAHIDDAAVAAVTALYRELLPPGGTILDLMSSWISHLPDEVAYAGVIGHGLNAQELAANPRLTRRFVQDLNADPVLPLGDASADAAAACVSIQYLQHPVAVLREVARVLRPGGPMLATFSNRCFPTKAVAIWRMLDTADQARLVALYLERAGFTGIETRRLVPEDGPGDPLTAVIGRAPGS